VLLAGVFWIDLIQRSTVIMTMEFSNQSRDARSAAQITSRCTQEFESDDTM
jgi:hypothetical protein